MSEPSAKEKSVPLPVIKAVFNKERAAIYSELSKAERAYQKAKQKQRQAKDALVAARAKVQVLEEMSQEQIEKP